MHVKQDMEQNTGSLLKVTHWPVSAHMCLVSAVLVCSKQLQSRARCLYTVVLLHCILYSLFCIVYQGTKAFKAVGLDWNISWYFGHSFSCYLAVAGSSIEQSQISGFKGDLIDFH